MWRSCIGRQPGVVGGIAEWRADPDMAFITDTDGDRLRCVVCHREYGHATTCPIVELTDHVRDVVSHLGVFVANMRESLDAIAALLRDAREP